ncbi:TlpA family protein disulfide reductase [Bacterioplanes sanyensis]|nr:TlpA disulfide reductase family protein [Bacterioplanes sanyensis]
MLPIVFVLLSSWMTRSMLDSGVRLAPLSVQTLSKQSLQLQWQHPTTLVYAFAPWCGVCRVSMPSLNLLQNENVRIVAIGFDFDSTDQVQQFVTDIGYDGEVYLGDAKLFQQLQLSGYPSYYVVSRDGAIRHKDRGLSTPPGLWLRTHSAPG